MLAKVKKHIELVPIGRPITTSLKIPAKKAIVSGIS